MREINQRPRRWASASGRIRVVEGWHPSAPDEVGYNLLVDDDWMETFGTLEAAANAAQDQFGDVEPGGMALHELVTGPDGRQRRLPVLQLVSSSS